MCDEFVLKYIFLNDLNPYSDILFCKVLEKNLIFFTFLNNNSVHEYQMKLQLGER